MGKLSQKATQQAKQSAAGKIKKVSPQVYEFAINLQNRDKQPFPSEVGKLVEVHTQSGREREILLNMLSTNGALA